MAGRQSHALSPSPTRRRRDSDLALRTPRWRATTRRSGSSDVHGRPRGAGIREALAACEHPCAGGRRGAVLRPARPPRSELSADVRGSRRNSSARGAAPRAPSRRGPMVAEPASAETSNMQSLAARSRGSRLLGCSAVRDTAEVRSDPVRAREGRARAMARRAARAGRGALHRVLDMGGDDRSRSAHASLRRSFPSGCTGGRTRDALRRSTARWRPRHRDRIRSRRCGRTRPRRAATPDPSRTACDRGSVFDGLRNRLVGPVTLRLAGRRSVDCGDRILLACVLRLAMVAVAPTLEVARSFGARRDDRGSRLPRRVPRAGATARAGWAPPRHVFRRRSGRLRSRSFSEWRDHARRRGRSPEFRPPVGVRGRRAPLCGEVRRRRAGRLRSALVARGWKARFHRGEPRGHRPRRRVQGGARPYSGGPCAACIGRRSARTIAASRARCRRCAGHRSCGRIVDRRRRCEDRRARPCLRRCERERPLVGASGLLRPAKRSDDGRCRGARRADPTRPGSPGGLGPRIRRLEGCSPRQPQFVQRPVSRSRTSEMGGRLRAATVAVRPSTRRSPGPSPSLRSLDPADGDRRGRRRHDRRYVARGTRPRGSRNIFAADSTMGCARSFRARPDRKD